MLNGRFNPILYSVKYFIVLHAIINVQAEV